MQTPVISKAEMNLARRTAAGVVSRAGSSNDFLNALGFSVVDGEGDFPVHKVFQHPFLGTENYDGPANKDADFDRHETQHDDIERKRREVLLADTPSVLANKLEEILNMISLEDLPHGTRDILESNITRYLNGESEEVDLLHDSLNQDVKILGRLTILRDFNLEKLKLEKSLERVVKNAAKSIARKYQDLSLRGGLSEDFNLVEFVTKEMSVIFPKATDIAFIAGKDGVISFESEELVMPALKTSGHNSFGEESLRGGRITFQGKKYSRIGLLLSAIRTFILGNLAKLVQETEPELDLEHTSRLAEAEKAREIKRLEVLVHNFVMENDDLTNASVTDREGNSVFGVRVLDKIDEFIQDEQVLKALSLKEKSELKDKVFQDLLHRLKDGEREFEEARVRKILAEVDESNPTSIFNAVYDIYQPGNFAESRRVGKILARISNYFDTGVGLENLEEMYGIKDLIRQLWPKEKLST